MEMDRRGAFRGGFGSYSFGSFGTSFDSRMSNGSIERGWTRSRSRGVRPAGIRNRRVTSDTDKPWTPVTKLGRLVKDGKVTTVEDIYLHSLSIKEYQIVDQLVPNMRDEVLKILPVQKMTRAGIRTRFKAFVAIGDRAGHVGLGVKCAKEVATAIRGAIYNAKTAVIPVRRAYWSVKHGYPHTIPCKVVGRYGDVQMRLFPAPRGSGIVAAPVAQKLLALGGIEDCFTSATNYSTLGHLTKATFLAIQQTYCYLPPRTINSNEDDSKQQLHWQFLSRKLIVNC